MNILLKTLALCFWNIYINGSEAEFPPNCNSQSKGQFMNTSEYLTYQKNREEVAHYFSTLIAEQKSAWKKGVYTYAYELAAEAAEHTWVKTPKTIEEALLNGATSWREYSYGGCSLIYDADIAERLCSPSELRRSLNGKRNPNRRERWLDVQARALRQAAAILVDSIPMM